MRYSVAALSAFAAFVVADPIILNTAVNPQEGTPFPLKVSGCESGCKVEMVTGESTNLQTVETLTADAAGPTINLNINGVPSGTYALRVTDSSGNVNYSGFFDLSDNGGSESAPAPTKSAASSAAPTSSGSASATKSESQKSTASETASSAESSATSSGTASRTTSESLSSTLSSATKTASSAATTPSSGTSTAFSRTPSSTSTKAAVTTSVPGSGAGQLSSPMGLVAGAVVAMAALL